MNQALQVALLYLDHDVCPAQVQVSIEERSGKHFGTHVVFPDFSVLLIDEDNVECVAYSHISVMLFDVVS